MLLLPVNLIAHGTRGGDFVLPKGWFYERQSRRAPIISYVGPSGKVKLDPNRGEIATEVNMHPLRLLPSNMKPPSKIATKARGTVKMPSVSTIKSKIPPLTEEEPLKMVYFCGKEGACGTFSGETRKATTKRYQICFSSLFSGVCWFNKEGGGDLNVFADSFVYVIRSGGSILL